MTSQWSYTVTHYDESDSYSATVLETHDIDSLPMFTDQGSAEVNRAIIRLNAPNGKFLIDSASTQPYIDQFDKIRITANDGQGNVYNRVFEVIEITPSEDNAQGTIAQVECLGNEWHTQYIHYAGMFSFDKTAFALAKDVGDLYNSNIGTKQPTLVYHDKPYNHGTSTDSNGTPAKLGNDMPKHNRSIYDYGQSELPCYDVWADLMDRQGASVDLGGVLDFFELAFDTSSTDLHKIHMRLFSSGADPQLGGGTPVTIDASTGGTSVNLNLDESEGGISAQRATRVMAWGEMGSLPNDWARYLAAEVDFIFRPEWSNDSIKYFADSKVRYKGKHYKASSTHTSSLSNPPDISPSLWSEITFASVVGNVIQYSPYTDDKVNIWKHMGADPTGTPKMWDGNLVINYVDQENSNNNFFRTWVFSSTNTAPKPYYFDENGINNSGIPKFFRFLNKQPNLSGTDSNTGKLYQQSILEWDGGDWVVKYDPRDVGSGFQVAVIDEGKIWEWNGTAWVDVSASTAVNDCFHPYTSIANVAGQQQGTPIDLTTKNFTGINKDCAVEVTNTFATITALASSDYYKSFCGLCFAYPFPIRTNASYSERVGDLYGNKTTGLPATFDPQNMNFTPDGNRGFNKSDSEHLGQVTGLAFFCRIKYTLGNSTNRNAKELLVANIPVRVTCYDTSDNVVTQDQTIAFRNNWEDLYFALSGFKIYRGAVPVAKSDSVPTLMRPKEQEAANVFEWRNLKLISIQVQSFYDDHGRYSPLKELTTGEFLSPQSQVPIFGATVTMAIDAFRWVKRNLVSTGVDTTRNIEAPFLQRPQIFSYNQLKKDAIAMQQIEQFRHKEFVISTQGKFDIKFGDSFFYKNPRLVNDADNGANTIKLVAKKIEYSLIKGQKSKGGFVRRIHGVKRFS